MRYRRLGRTNVQVSALGLGAMRLPGFENNVAKYNEKKEQAAIEIAHHAFDMGVNYIDTAANYGKGNNEKLVGKILKGYRDKVYLATKNPEYWVKQTSDYRRFLDEQLERLEVDHIDFYFFHDVRKEWWTDIVLKYDLLNEAVKAKQEGLIKHIAISTHDKPETAREMIDTGIFDVIMLQYNLYNREHEETIKYARKKDIGVVIMGPVLAVPSKVIAGIAEKTPKSTPETALRFVLGNNSISCALSGMCSKEMVEQNVKIACEDKPLDEAEWKKINSALEEVWRMSDIKCTGCDYCTPCPAGINISYIMEQLVLHKVYGLTRTARYRLKGIGKAEGTGKHPSECKECGACEEKCPQRIEIIKQLKNVVEELL